MNWLVWAIVPVAVFGLWLYTAQISASLPLPTGKRIYLLIAHPDDEAMFFGPTLLALTKPELGNHVKILCFSSGNADGLGEIRKKELVKSGLVLGLRNETDVVIIDDARFPDSMTATWDIRLLSDMMTTSFAPKAASTPSNKPLEANIDVLITFDGQGVSSHPNHISLFNAARRFQQVLMQRHAGWECPVALYSLTSTNIVRKYMSVLDAPMTVVSCLIRRKESGKYPTPLFFVSGPVGYRKAQRAMTTAHRSQMRWFRWGWIGISRYMIMNDLKKEKVL